MTWAQLGEGDRDEHGPDKNTDTCKLAGNIGSLKVHGGRVHFGYLKLRVHYNFPKSQNDTALWQLYMNCATTGA